MTKHSLAAALKEARAGAPSGRPPAPAAPTNLRRRGVVPPAQYRACSGWGMEPVSSPASERTEGSDGQTGTLTHERVRSPRNLPRPDSGTRATHGSGRPPVPRVNSGR